MGTYKENETKKRLNDCLGCLWSFLVSLVGGLLLLYWESRYHLTSSQLWMVPAGLILLVTPVVVWTAVVVSEICISTDRDGEFQTSQLVISKDKYSKDVNAV